MGADQTERAFQKQSNVFLNRKGGLKASESRWHCNPGLGFKIPAEAKLGNYIDKKCLLTGIITKLKMKNTAVIRRDYLHYVKKYNRFEKRHKNVSIHLSPCFRDVQVGDIATVGECRPLSKTVKFNTLKITGASKVKKSFAKF